MCTKCFSVGLSSEMQSDGLARLQGQLGSKKYFMLCDNFLDSIAWKFKRKYANISNLILDEYQAAEACTDAVWLPFVH